MYYYTKLLSILNSNGWLFKILTLFVVYLEPSIESALLLYALVIIDCLTGIAVAIKQGKKYNSKGLKPTIEKIIWYTVYIITIHLFQIHFVKDFMNIFQILIAIPIIREVTSIVENVEAATQVNIATQAKNILAGFFDKLKSKDIPEENKDDKPDE